VIPEIIAAESKRNFSRSIRFREEDAPVLPPAGDGRPRLLYLHVPFCESLCPYCSFNRVLFREPLCRSYFAALRREIRLYREIGHTFSGVYVGGGTPTVLVDELAETLATARDCFPIREISVETNPNHLVPEILRPLKDAGVNRLSVGIQSFDDGLLRAMGRFDAYGSGEGTARRLEEVKGVFDTLNADMIFNFPAQSPEILEKDLDRLLGIGPDQVTYYPLMVSDMTRSAMARTVGNVDFRRERKYYRRIVNALTPEFRSSSAWCFSRKKGMIDEYIVDYDEYAGLGSGSIGYMKGRCYANTFDISRYVRQVEAGEFPLMASRAFSLRDRVRYDFVMKLFGLKVDTAFFREKYGRPVLPILWKDIAAFSLAGGIRYRNGAFELTKKGAYYWVVIMREFFTAVNNFRSYCLDAAGRPAAGR
jgi:coproporphyrinogen III oxidase-like Fe-S oxidoreductase